MKAVLMNSADKLKDDGTFAPQGDLLGMTKTITDTNGKNWLQSSAYDDDVNTGDGFIAVDPQMGTGQLNAARARKQLAAGEFHSFQASDTYTQVPVIGWDYGQRRPDGAGSSNVYKFNQELKAGPPDRQLGPGGDKLCQLRMLRATYAVFAIISS
jgi:hypothetical protein